MRLSLEWGLRSCGPATDNEPMKRIIATAALLIGLLAVDAGLLKGKSQSASPAEVNDLLNVGRHIGWIQALCSITQWKLIEAEVTSVVISSVLEDIALEPRVPGFKYGAEKATWIAETVAENNPACRTLIPKKYLNK